MRLRENPKMQGAGLPTQCALSRAAAFLADPDCAALGLTNSTAAAEEERAVPDGQASARLVPR